MTHHDIHIKRRRRAKEVERVLHFCGISFWDESSPEQRYERADKYLKWVLSNE